VAAAAVSAYRTALDLAPAVPERDFITRRIEELSR
jgi:predicted RNA polymerase sigma factor